MTDNTTIEGPRLTEYKNYMRHGDLDIDNRKKQCLLEAAFKEVMGYGVGDLVFDTRRNPNEVLKIVKIRAEYNINYEMASMTPYFVHRNKSGRFSRVPLRVYDTKFFRPYPPQTIKD
jgi:hypothetical protein